MSKKSSPQKVFQKTIPVATFQKPASQAPTSTGSGGAAQSTSKTLTTQNQQGSK